MNSTFPAWAAIYLLGLLAVLAIFVFGRRRFRAVCGVGLIVALMLMFRVVPAWTASFDWAQLGPVAGAHRNVPSLEVELKPALHYTAENTGQKIILVSGQSAADLREVKEVVIPATAGSEVRKDALEDRKPVTAKDKVEETSRQTAKEAVKESSPAPEKQAVKETKAPPVADVVKKVETDIAVQRSEASPVEPAAREPAREPRQSRTELNFSLRKNAAGHGVLYLDDELVTDALLDSKAPKEVVKRYSQQVFLTADRGIPYREVIAAVDRLAGKGWPKISLKTTTDRDERQAKAPVAAPATAKEVSQSTVGPEKNAEEQSAARDAPQVDPGALRDRRCNIARRRWNLEVYPSPVRLRLPGLAVAVGHIEPLRHDVEPSYRVRRAEKAITIDGKLSEWTTIPAIRLDADNFVRGGRPDTALDVSGRLQMQWDNRGLNLALDVTDNVVNHPNPVWSDWENDSCQFMFDGLLNGPSGAFDDEDLSYCVSRRAMNRAVLSHYRMRGSDREVHNLLPTQNAAFSQTPQGYVYEWSVPWEELGPVSPFVLGSSGFSFTINDNDGSGFEGALAWTGGAIYGLDAGKLGRIVFTGAVGTRDAALELLPQHGGQFSYYLQGGLKLPENGPNHATVLVQPKQETDVAARILVYRQNSLEPFAKGKPQAVRCGGRLGTGVFVWDLTQLGTLLPSGETVKVAYETSLLPQEQPTMVPYRVVGRLAPPTAYQGAPSPGPTYAGPPPPRDTYVQMPPTLVQRSVGYRRSSGNFMIGPIEVFVLIAALALIVALRWGLARVITARGIAVALVAAAVAMFLIVGYVSVQEVSRRSQMSEALQRIGRQHHAQNSTTPIPYPTVAPVIEQPNAASTPIAPPPAPELPAGAFKTNTAAPRPRTSGTLKPSWVNAGPRVEGTVYQVTVTSGPWSTASECELAIQRAVKEMADLYMDNYLGQGASADLRLDALQLTQLLRTDRYTTTRKTSVGEMQEHFALLEFSDPVRQHFYQLWRSRSVERRLIGFGSAAGAIVLALALARFFLRRGIAAPPLALAGVA